MFLIRTRLGPSAIHGVGVFAAEDVPAGAEIWRFVPVVDQLIPLDRVPQFPAAFRAYLDMYAYEPPAYPGHLVLSADHAKFLNHSVDPNTTIMGDSTLARHALHDGDEITCDYRAVVSGWSGFGEGE